MHQGVKIAMKWGGTGRDALSAAVRMRTSDSLAKRTGVSRAARSDSGSGGVG